MRSRVQPNNKFSSRPDYRSKSYHLLLKEPNYQHEEIYFDLPIDYDQDFFIVYSEYSCDEDYGFLLYDIGSGGDLYRSFDYGLDTGTCNDLSINSAGQSQICLDDPTVAYHFFQIEVDTDGVELSDYDVVLRTMDINGNEAEDKEHIDSVWETFVKLVLSGLIWLAEVIIELATAAINWIWDAITAMFDAVIKPIVDAIQGYVVGVSKVLDDAFADLDAVAKDAHDVVNAFWDKMTTSGFFYGLIVMIIVITAISAIITPFTAIVTGLGNQVIDCIQPIIIQAIIGGAIVAGAAAAIEIIAFTVLYLITPEDDSCWQGSLGLAIVSFATALAKIYIILTAGVKELGKIFKDAMGLIFACIGLIFVIIPTNIIMAFAGFLMASIGFVMTLSKDALDWTGGALSRIEEIISGICWGYSIYSVSKAIIDEI